jgi:class 3 adenylate cyclase
VNAPPLQARLEQEAAFVQTLQRLVPREFTDRLRATRGQVSRERRLVTILFSDVTGSTSMAEGLDPEEMTDNMSSAFELLIKLIYHYEGTVARLTDSACRRAEVTLFQALPLTRARVYLRPTGCAGRGPSLCRRLLDLPRR